MAGFLDAAYAIMVEEITHTQDPLWVPLSVAAHRVDTLIGMPVEPLPEPEADATVENDGLAAQNDQALADLRSMMTRIAGA